MKNQISGWLVIGYIFLAFLCCYFMVGLAYSWFYTFINDENIGIIVAIQTMGAFIIGAIYLFGGNRADDCDDLDEFPEHNDNDETD